MVSGVLAGAVAAVVLAAGGATGPVAVAVEADGTAAGGGRPVQGPGPQPRPVPHRDLARGDGNHGFLGHGGLGHYAGLGYGTPGRTVPARGASSGDGLPGPVGEDTFGPDLTSPGAGGTGLGTGMGTGLGSSFGDVMAAPGTLGTPGTLADADRPTSVLDPVDATDPVAGVGSVLDPSGTPGGGTTTDGFQTVVSEQAAAAGGGGERPQGSYSLRLQSRFSAPSATLATPTVSSATPRAITYDPALVPVGASVDVEQRTDDDGTRVTLRVAGLAAGHAFGAHVHTGACATDPAAAGGHYQHKADPVQPSTDPAYANARNEVWLDLTTDALGAGSAVADHKWDFRPGAARSVVLHRTSGGAGERVACFTVPFRGW